MGILLEKELILKKHELASTGFNWTKLSRGK